MKYIINLLDNVTNINNFNEVEELTLVSGNATTLYFRLMTERMCNGESQRIRYIPTGTSVQVEVFFDNVDDNLATCRVGSTPFPGDLSIYCISILSQDKLAFNGMRVTVTEDGVKRNFIVVTDLASSETGDQRFFT